jgi:CBS domain-containing protein
MNTWPGVCFWAGCRSYQIKENRTMRAAGKAFFALTAEDLMTREVVTIPQEMSLPAAARLLSRARISGAPVVDVNGACVGVVSATDFLTLVQKDSRTRTVACSAPLCVCSEWQVMELPELPFDEVRNHMTADPVTVRPTTPVSDLARLMLDAHIHRLIVVDGKGRPVGIVSSTDLIAAVAQTELARPVLAGAVN